MKPLKITLSSSINICKIHQHNREITKAKVEINFYSLKNITDL